MSAPLLSVHLLRRATSRHGDQKESSEARRNLNTSSARPRCGDVAPRANHCRLSITLLYVEVCLCSESPLVCVCTCAYITFIHFYECMGGGEGRGGEQCGGWWQSEAELKMDGLEMLHHTFQSARNLFRFYSLTENCLDPLENQHWLDSVPLISCRKRRTYIFDSWLNYHPPPPKKT